MNSIFNLQFKKLLLSFLASFVLLFSVAPILTVNAQPAPAPQGTWYNQGFTPWFQKVYDPNTSSEIFGERYTAAQVQWVIYGLFAFILNSTTNAEALSCIMTNAVDLSACASFFAFDQSKTAPIASIDNSKDDKSLLQLVFADHGFSGITYTKDLVAKFGTVPVANAQTAGFGFDALSVVQDMWRMSRNVAFGMFVLAAIVFAFMIMFRVKINPQTVISIQSAIPKLIISLILVTFSYAIAGFLVDLMYVAYGLLSVVGTGFISFGSPDPTSVFQFLTAGRLGIGAAGIDTGIFGLIVLYIVLLPIAIALTLFTTLGVLQSLILAGVTVLLTLIAPALVNIFIILGIIILIIAILMLIWSSLKIIWALLKTYVNILLLTIFAPLYIVAGVLVPSLGFSSWIRSYISNLAVFITTSALMFFAFVFMLLGVKIGLDSIAGVGTGFIDFVFNLLLGSGLTTAVDNFSRPSPWPPLLGSAGITGGATGMIGLLMLGVSFVLFTLVPKATEIVQGIISGRPFTYGSAIGEFARPGAAYGLYGIGSFAQGQWPFPLNFIPGIGFRRAPDGSRVNLNPPEALKSGADAIREPINTVTKITRG